jgi:hypothetical protein
LADLSARGIELKAHDGRLRFRPQSAMTQDLAQRLKALKPQLLAILQSATGRAAEAKAIIQHVRANGDDDRAQALTEAWQERLSICTADGALTLAEAEAVTLEQLKAMLAFQ